MNMEEYSRMMTLACIPYAMAKKTKPAKDLYAILDSVDHLKPINRPKRINLETRGDFRALNVVLTALFSHFEFDGHCKNKARADIFDWLRSIRQKRDIGTLLSLFKKFDNNFTPPKDAIAFLYYLLKIFNRDVVSTKIFKTVGPEGSITCARIDKESSPVQYISPADMATRKKIRVHDLIDNKTSVRGREEMVQSDIVIFACGRVADDGSFVKTRVIATPSLTTPNGDRFFLGSIVAQFNGDYISYVRDGNEWFLHDDLKPKCIGGYDDMFSGYPNPSTNGVIYVYFPDYSSSDEYLLTLQKSNDEFKELIIGVFEDKITNKLLYLTNKFDSVNVSKNLPVLKRLTREKTGNGRLRILDIPSFLRVQYKKDGF